MRWLYVGLLSVVSVIVTVVSGSPSSAPGDDAVFRVVTFNIHKGADRRNSYDLERAIEVMAGVDADLVGVQEVMRNHAGFNCDDQPALIADGLRRATGQPWTYTYVQSWTSESRRCADRGQGDGVDTEGLAFFAPERIIATKSIRLTEGRLGLMALVESMPNVPVVVTHLVAGRDNQSGRARELSALLPWAERYRSRILMGDFNATPRTNELAVVTARYRDAWVDAFEQGRTLGVETGATRPGRRGSRIDYVFYAPGSDLVLESVEVIDTSLSSALDEASDHRPVVATFRHIPTGT